MHHPSHTPSTLLPALPALLFSTLLTGLVNAGEPAEEVHIVKFQAGDTDVIEADVTDLVVGESQTFVTGTGDNLDILRTPEGLELYLNGELLDSGPGGPVHQAHTADRHEHGSSAGKRVERTCEADEATGDLTCDEEVWITGGADLEWDEQALPGDQHVRIVVIEKEQRTADSD